MRTGSISAAAGATDLGPSLLSDLSRFVETRMGLYFPAARHRDLKRSICSAARRLGYHDVRAYAKQLLSSPSSHDQIEILASHLTIGETYLFRGIESFDALADQVLPQLIGSSKGTDRQLRIWSVGCSTGEEAYSIAILLDKMIHDLNDWNITILATDINPDFLNKAAGGVYRDWSFRNTPEWVKKGYFTETGNGFEILPHIRKMVTFAYHNIVVDPYPALANNTTAMNIIFFRNVLMYFSRERGLDVVQRLSRCLVDDGWLIVNPVESHLVKAPLFEGVGFPGATLYRKTAGRVRPPAAKGSGIPVINKTGQGAAEEAVNRVKEVRKGEPARLRKDGQAQVRNLSVNAGPVTANRPTRESVPLPALARMAADKGELSRALELCEKAIGEDKLNPSLYYLQATILREIGKADRAVISLRRAIYIDQDFVLAHFALGHLMHQQGKSKEAERHFRNACALLESHGDDAMPAESEGISAGRLMEIIRTTRQLAYKR